MIESDWVRQTPYIKVGIHWKIKINRFFLQELFLLIHFGSNLRMKPNQGRK
jgi:hypothetical protein